MILLGEQPDSNLDLLQKSHLQKGFINEGLNVDSANSEHWSSIISNYLYEYESLNIFRTVYLSTSIFVKEILDDNSFLPQPLHYCNYIDKSQMLEIVQRVFQYYCKQTILSQSSNSLINSPKQRILEDRIRNRVLQVHLDHRSAKKAVQKNQDFEQGIALPSQEKESGGGPVRIVHRSGSHPRGRSIPSPHRDHHREEDLVL